MASLYLMGRYWISPHGYRLSRSYRIWDRSPPPFWMALALFHSDHHFWRLPLIGIDAPWFSENWSHRFDSDLNDSSHLCLSGLSIETRYRWDLFRLSTSKRSTRDRASKRKWSLDLGSWDYRSHCHAPQSLPSLIHLSNPSSGLQGPSWYQACRTLYDLGLQYWVGLGLCRQFSTPHPWGCSLLWTWW